MTVQIDEFNSDWSQNGGIPAFWRVLSLGRADLESILSSDVGNRLAEAGVRLLKVAVAENADFRLVDGSDEEVADDGFVAAMPLIVFLPEHSKPVPALLDVADWIIHENDSVQTLAKVFADVGRHATRYNVRDLSDGASRTINALSQEAGRIAAALARLAGSGDAMPPDQAVDAALVRRLLRLRRDRARFLPADIFADPAWDMLLDLAAARLEDRPVPVSSLCIAAAVPTSTALRWVRSLSEAGLLERRADPGDARRSHISLSDAAAQGVFAWLRLFSSQFAPR